MSILQKGTLTVVIATVITSGIIISTNDTIANEKGEINTASGNLTSSQSSRVKNNSRKESEKHLKNNELNKAGAIVADNAELAPPPGPFLNRAAVKFVQPSLSAPVAPKKPTYVSQQLVQPVQPVGLDAKTKIPPVSPSVDKMLLLAKAPEFKAVAPVNPRKKFKQPGMMREELPIWMQKNNAIHLSKILSKAGEGPYQDKADIDKKRSTVQYIYVPVPMMPINMPPPQMPAFNRSITPPSIYWGAGVDPLNAANIAIKKGSRNNDEQMQKGHN